MADLWQNFGKVKNGYLKKKLVSVVIMEDLKPISDYSLRKISAPRRCTIVLQLENGRCPVFSVQPDLGS